MTKKKKILILGILLLAALGTGIVVYTYSRYLSRATGTADLKVATWAVKVNNTDIVQSTNFIFDENNITWSPSDYIEEGYIAPSRTGTIRLRLDTTGSKVAVKYTISVDTSILDNYKQINITKINGQPATNGNYTGVISLDNVDTPIDIPIEIAWINDEANNESDTTIGTTITKFSIPITVTAEQKLVEDTYCLDNGFNKLSDCMLVSETKSKTVEEAKSNITAKGTPDFSKTSTTSDGLYSTLDDDGTSYYYRGDVRNNYVSYAGYIWRMIRMNGNGSVRMIYSGRSTSSTGEATSIGASPFNLKYWDPTYVGYKYNENFGLNETANASTGYNNFTENVVYYFGQGYTFDETTKRFKLTGSTISGKWKDVYQQAIASYPYTCFSTSATGTCDVLKKMTGYTNAYTAKVHLISNSSKDYNSTLLNTTDSTIKTKLESWYATNILNKKDAAGKLYTDYISDEVFCNDRSVTSGSGYLLSPTTLYGPYTRIVSQKTPTLKCKQAQDRFSVSSTKGNAGLKYPIGLITIDEASMAGGLLSAVNTQYYLYTGQTYWTLSPYTFNSWDAYACAWYVTSTGTFGLAWVSSGLGVRPIINLSSDVLISGGDGTAGNPYTVKLA